MVTGNFEDHYVIKPDAFGRFEVYVRHGDKDLMRPRGRFTTAEAAQAWVDGRKAPDIEGRTETAMQALVRSRRATVNSLRRG